MLACEDRAALGEVCSVLPPELSREVRGLSVSCGEINEIRLRSHGVSQAVISGRNYPLFYRATSEILKDVLHLLCHGSLYAYRDSISEGYVSMERGVRVGVVGEARYEEGNVIGIDRISSLCFRIPTGRCDFADELYRGWLSLGAGSMLIASPPSGGKTTALRALARLIGSGENARRVVAVDERREMVPDDYLECSVDILRGYKRERGIELALRTMSPEVILVDEIGSSADASATVSARGAGVPLIATVHARDIEDASRRFYIKRMIDCGAFEIFARIERTGGEYKVELGRIGE